MVDGFRFSYVLRPEVRPDALAVVPAETSEATDVSVASRCGTSGTRAGGGVGVYRPPGSGCGRLPPETSVPSPLLLLVPVPGVPPMPSGAIRSSNSSTFSRIRSFILIHHLSVFSGFGLRLNVRRY